MDYAGLTYAFFGLVIASVSFQAVAMVPEPMDIQLITFVLFAVFRAFMFGSLGTVMLRVFGSHNLGRLVAVAVPFGGAVSMFQFLLFQRSMEYYEADFTTTSTALLVLACCTIAFPIYYAQVHGCGCRYATMHEGTEEADADPSPQEVKSANSKGPKGNSSPDANPSAGASKSSSPAEAEVV